LLSDSAGRFADYSPLHPFRWNEERSATLRADLDAYYAKLYGLTEEELRYILDPQDIYGPDFPGETFRVLKKNETKRCGEYRTRRFTLAAWQPLSFGSARNITSIEGGKNERNAF